jgi:hypothetical protein
MSSSTIIPSANGALKMMPGMGSTGYQSRQAFHVPEPKAVVTEHRAHTCLCPNCTCILQARRFEDISDRSIESDTAHSFNLAVRTHDCSCFITMLDQASVT